MPNDLSESLYQAKPTIAPSQDSDFMLVAERFGGKSTPHPTAQMLGRSLQMELGSPLILPRTLMLAATFEVVNLWSERPEPWNPLALMPLALSWYLLCSPAFVLVRLMKNIKGLWIERHNLGTRSGRVCFGSRNGGI